MRQVDIEGYQDFKDTVSNGNLPHYYAVRKDSYDLYAFNGPIMFYHKLDPDDVSDYDAGLKLKANKSTVDTSGHQIMAPMKPTGLSDGTIVTHDLCDKTTWYQKATQHTSITLADQGGGLTFKHTDHTHWIDLTHGKLSGEDDLDDQKEPKVYVNSNEVTSGFSINYSDGSVIFENAPGGTVTADFWKAGSSEFAVIPDPGKVLQLEHAELQFAKNVMMNDPIRFEIWVYNPGHQVPGHPLEHAGLKIPYKTIRYKNIKDIINSANLGQGFIPAISGLSNDVVVFPFNYVATKPLQSSVGAELRIRVEGDNELPGEWATATFYFVSEVE